MKIGMTLPVTEPGWNRDILLQWAEKIDTGPFSSLALGERVFFPSPELMTTLGACAVLTKRVKLVTTVVILPMHNPVLTAKQLATVDVLSEGRLVVGVGTGGRAEDYLATGTDLSQKRIAVMASHVQTMREIWRGEYQQEGALRPVEPLPVQKNGPPVLAGVMGPKGLASAAQWADGVTGMSVAATADDAGKAMQMANGAWQQAGHTAAPHFNSAFWFATGESADQQMHTHLTRYFNWLDEGSRDAMAKHAGFKGSVSDLTERLKAFADTGMDEVLLIPTSIDPAEVDRAAEAIAAL